MHICNIHRCKQTNTQTHTYTHTTCIHRCKQTNTQTHTYTHTTCIHTHTHNAMHTHTHKDMHTDTNTHFCVIFFPLPPFFPSLLSLLFSFHPPSLFTAHFNFL